MEARLQIPWKQQKTASFHVLHTRSREEANDPEFTKPLEDATAVWFVGGNQNAITHAYLGTRTDEQFQAVLKRGGVVGGTSAGAAIMSRVMISGMKPDGSQTVLVGTGLGFAPGLIVDQHFRKRNRQARLLEALEQWPGHVGVGIDEGTALIIRGSKAEVMGVSDVTLALGAAPGRPSKLESLGSGQSADLAALSRAAISRMPARDVAARPPLKKGTLMLIGAGDAPDEVRDQFLQAAGGKDAAIVVVSAGEGDGKQELELCDWLRSAGASNVKAIVARTRQEIESPEFLSTLAGASGIWLSDAPLRRLVDAYVDTSVQRMLEKLLERDGVIAGCAACATLSGSALPATTEANEPQVVSEAYERGLGFLPGMVLLSTKSESSAAVERADLKAKHPQLLSVELTDSTALIVRGSTLQVVGKNSVTVLSPRLKDAAGPSEPARVGPGETYSFGDFKRPIVNGD
jgi:cyanophycinase